LAAWPTPNAMQGGQTSRGGDRKDELLVGGLARLLDSGATQTGSPAQTEKPGQLDPDHSRWAMGYEIAHLSCAPTETRSSLRSRQSSS
jgi:hypothetical protein